MINEDVWKLLEKLYTEFPSTKCNDVADKQICEAEDFLNLKFSDFYRFFLKNHAVNAIGEYTIKTLDTNTPSTLSVIDATIKFRETKKYLGYENYYIVSINNQGNLIAANNKGEISYIGYDNEPKEKIANNFEEFIHKLLLENS